MYVRLTYFSLPAEKVAEIIKVYHEEVAPVIKQQPGVVNVLLFEPVEESGEFISCTTWEREDFTRAFEQGGDYKEVFGKIKAAATNAPVQRYYHTSE